jgi:hypothetical protein
MKALSFEEIKAEMDNSSIQHYVSGLENPRLGSVKLLSIL